MSSNIAVNFKVSGSELSSYIDSIQKKSDVLTASAIKGAAEQSSAAKEQLKIINETISALERKNRLETQAGRSILGTRKEEALAQNKDVFEGRRNETYNNKDLTEVERKEKLTAIDGSERSGEEKIKNEYRENLSAVKEQERQSKIQTTLSRESIQTAKEAAREQISAISKGDKSLGDVYREVGANGSEEEKLTLSLIEDELKEKKRKEDKEAGPGVLTSILGAENIQKLIGSVGQLTQTKDGFDLIAPASQGIGQLIGGLLGGIVGTFLGPAGTMAGMAMGSTFGGAIGGTLGDYEQREAQLKQSYLKSANRYGAITSGTTENTDVPDLYKAGVDPIQFLQQQAEYAKRRGSASGSASTTRDAIYAEKGYGIDQGTSAGLIDLQRSTKESNRDLAGLIGGVLEKGAGNIFKGGDTTFLGEFLGKFTSLQKELLKTSSEVPTGLTMDLLNQFNKVGGQFDLRDPRSMGNINAIQNSLSNPGSDNMKALGYRILAEQNPTAGTFDLRESMQKGLGSPGYLKGVLQYIDRVGGDDQSKLNNLSGAFSSLPLAAVRQLFNNRESLENGKLSVEELQARFPGDFKTRAEANTTLSEKESANVNRGILGGEGVEKMAEAFKEAIESTLGGAVIQLNDNKGTITLLPKTAPVRQNTTSRPGEDKIGPATPYPDSASYKAWHEY